jgi:phosphoglycerol transferase
LTEQVEAKSRVRGFARWTRPAQNGARRDEEGEHPQELAVQSANPFGDGPSPGGLGRKLLWALAVFVVCSGLVLLVYGFTSPEGMRAPLAREDNFFYASIVQNIRLEGWYEPTDDLGWPHGQQLLDFPMGDNHLYFLILVGLTRLVANPLTVLNLHVVLAFGMIGAITYLCLRSVGVWHWPAVVASILFAFLPYHFARATYHTFLQAYWQVPLILPLLKWAFGGRLLRRQPLEWLLVAVMAVVIGSTGVYYAAFLVILLVVGAGLELLRTHRPAAVGKALGVSAVIGVVLVVNYLPSIRYFQDVGVNHELAQRDPREAESFGLRPSLLLLPAPDHRVARLAEIGQRTHQVNEPSEGAVSLGVVAGAGLVLAIGAVMLAAVRARPGLAAAGYCGVLSLVAILFGTKGGISYAMALFGTKQLRTWSRISVFIGLFALAFLALRMPGVQARLGRWATAGVLVGALVVGLVDQIPGNPNPRRGEVRPELTIDRVFTRRLERALPQGAAVFQYPVVRYPEEPPPGIASGYDDLRFHILGTGKLRYSYGGSKGREQQWQERWADAGPAASAVAAAAAGFSAVIVDRFGFEKDTGKQAEAELSILLGPPVSDDTWRHRYAWYDLRPLRQRLEQALPGTVDEVGQVVTHPPFLRWKNGGQAYANVFPVTRELQPYATLEVSTPVPRAVRLEGALLVPDEGHLLARFEGQVIARLPAGEHRVEVPLTLTRPETTFEFELFDISSGRRMDDEIVQVRGLHVVDPVADVVIELARSWTQPPPPPPPPAPPDQ